ncbi:HD domain-containing protein [Kamptonema cortianum]|nr:HD domain-containing protein [Kamptonema cortianum]
MKHPAIATVAEALQGAGLEGRIFLVGGCVRDELLGSHLSDDFDIVVDGDAHEVARLLYDKGVCLQEPQIYARFGTALVLVRQTKIELASARKESYSPGSRKPQVQQATLEEDAWRRDFTVNTLMKDVFTGKLFDPTGQGMADLKAKILRTPQDPDETFSDDPLRMLRAVRFRWKLGFEPAEDLYPAIQKSAHRLRIISNERINEELTKMLLCSWATEALIDMQALGLLGQFAPELDATVGVEQGRWHDADVWNHTLQVVKNAGSGDLTLTLACLLHDVGKPITKTLDEKGDIRFFGHETVGADIAYRWLTDMKYGQRTAESVALLVKNHMRLCSMDSLSLSAARRIVRDLGDHLDHWLSLIEADASALKKGVRKLDLDLVRRKLEEVQIATPAPKLTSPLDGHEIMALLGVDGGEIVGRAKEHLTELVLDGKLEPDDRQSARVLLSRWIENLGSNPDVAGKSG